MIPALLMIAASVALLVAALLLLLQGRQRSRSEFIARKLRTEQMASRPVNRPGQGRWLVRLPGGVNLSRRNIWLIVFVIVPVAWLTYLLLGLTTALALITVVFAILYVTLYSRHQRQVQKMVQQTPSLLDHMVRSLKSGRTLANAMVHAMERCQNPLHDAFSPTRRSIELGVPMSEALDEFAEEYDRLEFRILALGVRVNQRHGGNASELLQSLMAVIRDRERAERQLRAMTGETRLSAWVLGVLPLLLIAYLLATNPGLFLGMWMDSAGRIMLLTAMLFQFIGSLLLWRMLRSI